MQGEIKTGSIGTDYGKESDPRVHTGHFGLTYLVIQREERHPRLQNSGQIRYPL